jgi:hypothetical protein
MYAQFAFTVLTGACNARTPFLSCSMRFSWLQRPLASPIASAWLDRLLQHVGEEIVRKPHLSRAQLGKDGCRSTKPRRCVVMTTPSAAMTSSR